jgi:hypothetical protein
LFHENKIDLTVKIEKLFLNISIDPLSRFPQGGKAEPLLLPPWGKVGKGVYKRKIHFKRVSK